MKTKHTSITRKIMPGLIIILTLIILVGMTGITQATTSSPDTSYKAVSLEPNPTLNVNATWNTFYSSWKALEYNNGTANTSLNAGLSSYYKNPISVNPSDIESPILQENITHKRWQNPAEWTIHNGPVTITNTSNSITFEAQDNSTTAKYYSAGIYLNPAYLPSSNLQYDYVTITGTFTETSPTTNGLDIYLWESNQTESNYGWTINIYNNTAEIGKGTSSPTNNQPFYMTIPLSDFLTNPTMIQISPQLNTPAGTGSESTTITGMAMTENPITFGTMEQQNGTAFTPRGSFGNLHLQSFAPDIPYSEISNNGYTVSISQALQNVHISKSSINNANYIEEVTYQGSLGMPSAPDLTYGNANISMNITIPGKQFQVFTIGGQSYISDINEKNNGTFAISSVNPITPQNIIIEVEYTSTQWDKVSSPPSFWSNPIQTIEYYWYVALGAALGIIGLGAGIKSHSNSNRVIKR